MRVLLPTDGSRPDAGPTRAPAARLPAPGVDSRGCAPPDDGSPATALLPPDALR
ncbi:hypothetical protein [Streptomyces griseosporeus]|uniref:hypothetical protein n=1 Tax=Streptomyces griseosporeus TaxID=1910 RepID=UPI00167EA3D7|nr:hypothetical protein [Streptomyces griseosporeus]